MSNEQQDRCWLGVLPFVWQKAKDRGDMMKRLRRRAADNLPWEYLGEDATVTTMKVYRVPCDATVDGMGRVEGSGPVELEGAYRVRRLADGSFRVLREIEDGEGS